MEENTNWIKAGNVLRELRTQMKQSVHKVAKEVHISGNYLSLIERGIKAPSDEVLYSLAEYYKMDKTELFALYDRVLPEGRKLLMTNPPFRRTITHISLDERLTEDERTYLSEKLYEIYEGLIRNKEKNPKEDE